MLDALCKPFPPALTLAAPFLALAAGVAGAPTGACAVVFFPAFPVGGAINNFILLLSKKLSNIKLQKYKSKIR
jgi:hypothetical protein